MEGGDLVWVWYEGFGVFGVDVVFDCVVGQYYVVLFDVQFLVGGDVQLFVDQVDVGYYFCYWMFYLYVGVYFDEVEMVVFVQEFEGVCVVVVDMDVGFYVDFVDLFVQFSGDVWCWCFFYYFLVVVLY